MSLAAILSILILSAAPTDAQGLPKLGSNCVLSKMTPLATDASLAVEVVLSGRRNDRANLAALIQSGKVSVIPYETSARVVDLSGLNHAVKVRVLSGPALGFEGWLFATLC